jgi:hypothetical protein
MATTGAPGTYPVRFRALHADERYGVSVRPVFRGGGEESRCDAPCTMHLPPGRYRLRTSGTMAMSGSLRVGTEPRLVQISHIFRAPMVMVVLLGIGGGLTFAGLAAFANVPSGARIALWIGSPVMLALGALGIVTLVSPGVLNITNDDGRVARPRAPRAPLWTRVSAGIAPIEGGAFAAAGVTF